MKTRDFAALICLAPLAGLLARAQELNGTAIQIETDTSWHCNRHTFASRLVMAGVDLRTVAELLGHKTLQMVRRYSHLAPEHQASAVDRLVKIKIKGTPNRTPEVPGPEKTEETNS